MESYADIDLHQKGWLGAALSRFAEEIRQKGRVGVHQAPIRKGQPKTESWERMRSFGLITLRTKPGGLAPSAKQIFLETIALQCQLSFEYAQRKKGLEPADAPLLWAALLASLNGLDQDVEKILEIQDAHHDPHEKTANLSAQLKQPIRKIGKVHAKRKFPQEHPLVGSAFHRLVLYGETRLLLELCEQMLGATWYDATEAQRLRNNRRIRQVYFVEALIALAWVDGQIREPEARLLKEVISVGQFSDDELTMLKRCLSGETPSVKELALGIDDPLDRRFVLEQVMLTALIDGVFQSREEEFVHALAKAFGLEEVLGVIQTDVISHLQTMPDLMDKLSVGNTLNRIRKNATVHIEVMVKRNLGAILTEVRETGDLVRLLKKSATQNLSENELEQVKSQLIDVSKSIPSLALLAVPGSALLIPVLMKVLPFSLLPSAFDDDHHDLTR